MRDLRSTGIVLTAVLIASIQQSPVLADESEDLHKSLEAAELSFAASVAEKDWEGFGNHLDDQAIFVAGSVLKGKPAVLEAWSMYFADDAPKLEWHPEKVVVQADGKLGISTGPYTLTVRNEDGAASVLKGQFISIWQHQENRGWKIIFDSGCPSCPDCGSQ